MGAYGRTAARASRVRGAAEETLHNDWPAEEVTAECVPYQAGVAAPLLAAGPLEGDQKSSGDQGPPANQFQPTRTDHLGRQSAPATPARASTVAAGRTSGVP